MPDPQGYPIFELTNLQDTIVYQVWSNGTVVYQTGVTVNSGNGSPNSVVTAPPGSLYIQADGVAPNQLWQKQTGTGNTGWVAIGAGGGGGGTTTNPLTINNSGSGAASGSTFNGAAPITISYNSIGAAPLASPVFTGTPQAPTPLTADNSTNIATTAFVKAQGYAPLASPTFTGLVTTPTSALGGAGLNLPPGAVPTAPNNGDVWTTSGGFFARINGVTQQLGGTTNNCTFNNSGTGVASGTSFNGLTARIISYNTIGAAPTASPTFTGTVTLPAAITQANTTTFSPTSGALITWQIPTGDQLLLLFPDAVNGNSSATFGAGAIQLNASGTGGLILKTTSPSGNVILDKVSQYNHTSATAGEGLVAICGADAVSAQAANYNGGSAKTITNAVGTVNLFHIVGALQITQAATTSSVTPSLTINYNDVSGVARTLVVQATSASNVVGTLLQFDAKFMSNNTPSTLTAAGYSSTGATPMQYALAFACMALVEI